MSVLITGGSGFIGSNLALTFQENGSDVTVVDNFLSSSQENLNGFSGTVLKHDVTQPLPFTHSFDVVLHHGDITDPRSEASDVFHKNVSGFQNVLSFCLKHKTRLIYASSAGLYGNGPLPMKEDQPKDLQTAYAKSKLKMDEIAQDHFDQIPIIGLRYFNVFGPREKFKGRAASMVYHLFCQMKAGKCPRLFKSGQHQRDFVYIKDVIYANVCALRAKSGVYNVGTGIATTFNQLIHFLNQAMKTHFEPDYFDMPYDSKTYQHHTQADTAFSSNQLGFKSQWPLSDAIFDYCDWLQTQFIHPKTEK